jgi:hypothetical protein
MIHSQCIVRVPFKGGLSSGSSWFTLQVAGDGTSASLEQWQASAPTTDQVVSYLPPVISSVDVVNATLWLSSLAGGECFPRVHSALSMNDLLAFVSPLLVLSLIERCRTSVMVHW